jgi:hypothetical protein
MKTRPAGTGRARNDGSDNSTGSLAQRPDRSQPPPRVPARQPLSQRLAHSAREPAARALPRRGRAMLMRADQKVTIEIAPHLEPGDGGAVHRDRYEAGSATKSWSRRAGSPSSMRPAG